MNIMRAIKLRAQAFRTEERASMPIEGIIGSTFLLWWFISSYQFFDAFQQKNANLKAAYTISDMLSRETGPVAGDPNAVAINQNYINGLNTVFDYLTYSNQKTWIRVSSVYYDENDSKYRIDWSATSGTGHTPLTTVTLQQFKNRIPVLVNGDSVILVETYSAYVPFFYYKKAADDKSTIDIMESGISHQWLTNFITTSPRFGSCLPFGTAGCGTDPSGDWVRPDITDADIDHQD